MCPTPILALILYIPSNKQLGAVELVNSLLALSSSSPLHSGPDSAFTLSPTEVGPFLTDVCRRFESDGLEDILGEVITSIAHSEATTLPEGLGGSNNQWRNVLGALEGLAGIKPIAIVFTRLPQWNPPATAPDFEKVSLMGPIARMSVFGREWACRIYFLFFLALIFAAARTSTAILFGHGQAISSRCGFISHESQKHVKHLTGEISVLDHVLSQ